MATSTTTTWLSELVPVSQAQKDQRSETAQRALLRSVNLYNGETTTPRAEMTNDEVDDAIAAAHDRGAAWRRMPVAPRATLLHGAAQLCRERLEALTHVVAIEMEQRIVEGNAEIEMYARIFEHYENRGEHLLQPEMIELPAGDDTLLCEPLDVELPSTSLVKRRPTYRTLLFEISVRARLA